MGYKTLLFSQHCQLSVKNFQLVYNPENSNEDIKIPLEDISTIILEHLQIKLSNYLLSICGEYNITIFSCDKYHQPNTILTPFSQHSRTTKIVKNQINMSEPFKKRLWQKIVQQKITNQSNVLKILFNNEELDRYIEKVQSGDKTNIEGQTSKKYWSILFKNFKRHSETKQNYALNYGYAVLRGTLAKYIASSGLIPSIGVHHCSELNSFNLADDLIESFRPFIDLMVAEMKINEKDTTTLTKADKAYLLTILHKQCQYKNEQITVQNACEYTCQNFVKSLVQKDSNILDLPQFIGEK